MKTPWGHFCPSSIAVSTKIRITAWYLTGPKKKMNM
jgi:hypothetical protein